ncbi:uncharacterized protein LOC143021893 isoform X2 [Oratosquilla oratoria]|uniref:uncharacterized protein LOC143021893 isoform X2 n=1 Tax=Oratosquilla oratoria TaxID=337810 RepID=UPI003F75CAD2
MLKTEKIYRYKSIANNFQLAFQTEWSFDHHRVRWEQDANKASGELIQYDGIPYILLGTKIMECQHGVDRNVTQKMRYRVRKEETYPYNTKRRQVTPISKKLDCPAKIVLKDVVKFPAYRIERNFDSFRKQASRKLREDIFRGRAQSTSERRIYIQLPSEEDHTNHVLGENINSIICKLKNSKDWGVESRKVLEKISDLTYTMKEQSVLKGLHNSLVAVLESLSQDLPSVVPPLQQEKMYKKQKHKTAERTPAPPPNESITIYKVPDLDRTECVQQFPPLTDDKSHTCYKTYSFNIASDNSEVSVKVVPEQPVKHIQTYHKSIESMDVSNAHQEIQLNSEHFYDHKGYCKNINDNICNAYF